MRSTISRGAHPKPPNAGTRRLSEASSIGDVDQRNEVSAGILVAHELGNFDPDRDLASELGSPDVRTPEQQSALLVRTRVEALRASLNSRDILTALDETKGRLKRIEQAAVVIAALLIWLVVQVTFLQ